MDGDGELGQELIENASPGNLFSLDRVDDTTTLDVINEQMYR